MAKADKNWKNKVDTRRAIEEVVSHHNRIPVADLRIGDVIGKQKVTSIEECPKDWRTHIHVNKKDCYDTRSYVLVHN